HRGSHDVLPKPRRERFGLAELRQAAPSRQERVLDRIGGIGMGPGEDRGGTKGDRYERLDKIAECVPVTGDCCCDERSKTRRRSIQGGGLHGDECALTTIGFRFSGGSRRAAPKPGASAA